LTSALALVLLAGLSIAPPVQAWIGEGDPFCRPGVLRDYGAPFEGLPPAKSVPSRGEVPFAPSRVILDPPRTPVVVVGDPVQYGLDARGVRYGSVVLGWEVESRLVRVDFKGHALRIAKRSVQRVGKVVPSHPVDLGFARSPQPGLYRYVISFKKKGELLGRYWDYYRVVRRSDDVRLALNGTTFTVGDKVLGKLENDSTEWLFYGLGDGLESYEDGNWVPVNQSKLFGHRVVVPLIGLTAGPGTVAQCSAGFTVPETMSPGLYRMLKRVYASAEQWSVSHERPLDVMAEFQIE